MSFDLVMKAEVRQIFVVYFFFLIPILHFHSEQLTKNDPHPYGRKIHKTKVANWFSRDVILYFKSTIILRFWPSELHLVNVTPWDIFCVNGFLHPAAIKAHFDIE